MTPYVCRPRKSSSSAPQSKKRKVEHLLSDGEDENMYDGIKQLYNEEEDANHAQSTANSLRTSCSLEMHQDSDKNVAKKNVTNLLGQVLLVS